MSITLPSDTGTWLITGASAGIGTEFARQIAERGYNVTLAARRIERLTELAAELEDAHGVRAVAVACDVSNAEHRQELLDSIEARGDHVDILINNAGIGTEGAFTSFSPEENQRQIKVFAASIEDQEGLDFGLSECGSYLLASSLDELDDLKQSAQLMKEDGFDVELLTEDPIDRDFYGALFNPGDLAVNPAKLTRALIARSSAQVFEGEEVFAVKKSASGGKLVVSTKKRTLTASKVLLATNAYAALGSYALAEKLNVIRGQMLVTKPLKKRLEAMESICYANYGFEYFRQLPDNRMLLGGCRQQFMDEERGFGDTVTRSVQNALESYLKHRFPECAGIPVDYRFSGLMAFTNDGLPIVGEHEGLPGVFCAVGCNGHGLGFGLNLARMLINVALNGASAGTFSLTRETLKKPLAMASSVEIGP